MQFQQRNLETTGVPSVTATAVVLAIDDIAAVRPAYMFALLLLSCGPVTWPA